MKDTDLPLSLGKVAYRELKANGCKTLSQVALKTEGELLAIHGVGPKAIRILKQAFTEHGIDAVMSKTPPKR